MMKFKSFSLNIIHIYDTPLAHWGLNVGLQYTIRKLTFCK